MDFHSISKESSKGLSTTAFLNKPSDWTNWQHVFLLQVKTLDLEDHVLHKKSLKRKPTEPDIRKKKYTKTRDVRPQSVDGQDENDNTIQEKEVGSWMPTDLTEAGQKLYNMDYNWFKQWDASYQIQRSAVEKLSRWISKTVNPEYLYDCCSPED
jgi:hypothetical protein